MNRKISVRELRERRIDLRARVDALRRIVFGDAERDNEMAMIICSLMRELDVVEHALARRARRK